MASMVDSSSFPGTSRPPAVGRRAGSQLHLRQHGSMLAALEKRLLVRIAGHLPAWVTPDHLSALGLAAMVGVGLAFWGAGRWPVPALLLVPVLLFVNWFGDSLDGTLARVRRQERPRYGYYVDHVIDLTGTVALVAGLAASGFMSPTLALIVISSFLLVMAETFLATHARGVFHLSFLGWGPTELRILLAAGAMWMLRGPLVTPFGFGPYRLFDLGATIAAICLACVFLFNATANAAALYREERRN